LAVCNSRCRRHPHHEASTSKACEPNVASLREEVAVSAESLAEVTERLLGEFEPRLSLGTIVATVRECHRDLEDAGTPQPALPELVERLARQRLTELATQPPTQPDGP